MKPLHAWPAAARTVLTLFLVLIGAGYVSALLNLFHQHQLADGRAGLTLDDLRAVFHGIEPPALDTRAVVPESRMYEMVKTGGKMRKHLNNGGPEAVASLEAWLKAGAPPEQFSQSPEGAKTPASVIEFQCLDCHNAEQGDKSDAPFGPDMFIIDYEMVADFTKPGTAREPAPADAGPAKPPRIGPHSISHLALVTHIHMLSIPVFTLIVTGLYLIAGKGTGIRGLVAVLPTACLVLDFASWWLARVRDEFIYVIPAAGALYGLTMAIQILSVIASLWRRGAVR